GADAARVLEAAVPAGRNFDVADAGGLDAACACVLGHGGAADEDDIIGSDEGEAGVAVVEVVIGGEGDGIGVVVDGGALVAALYGAHAVVGGRSGDDDFEVGVV